MSVKAIKAVLENPIKGSAQAVLVVMAWHADRNTWLCWPSNDTLAKETGFSERTIKRAKKVLVECGKIKPAGKDNGNLSDIYKIMALDRGDSLTPHEDGNRGDTLSNRGDRESDRGDSLSDRGDSLSPNRKERKEREEREGGGAPTLALWLSHIDEEFPEWDRLDAERAYSNRKAKGWDSISDWRSHARSCYLTWKQWNPEGKAGPTDQDAVAHVEKSKERIRGLKAQLDEIGPECPEFSKNRQGYGEYRRIEDNLRQEEINNRQLMKAAVL